MPAQASPAENVAQAKHPRGPIYLDNHATTPIDPDVLEAMLPYLRESFGNPASTHSYGVRAQYAVSKARAQVATTINASEDEIFFTAGATESNNFVIKGVFDHFRDKKPHFIVSNIEHKCVLEAAKHIEKQGAAVTVVDVDKKGLISPAKLKKALRPNTVLVSIMFANNEIGSINPIKELAAICHEQQVLLHTDAAQAVGKVPIDARQLGIDLLSASGHKFYGPKGIGFVYVKKDVQSLVTPLLDGGGQEGNLRSGTLNVPGIVGLGKAIELCTTNIEASFKHYLTLRNRLYDHLVSAFPDLILNGPDIFSDEELGQAGDIHAVAVSLERLPHNLNITLPSIDPTKLGRIYTVAFSSTSACSSGNTKPSYVLMAIGRSPEEATASLRFGIGRFNTESDIDDAADMLIKGLQS
jgi:cysteine desulfurase